MAEKVRKFINDSVAARWGALILIALMMFFAYMFVDVMSPLKSMIESERGWSSTVFGTYAAAEYILNVCGFLIIAGIILDKMGVRYTGVLSASLMLAGACIKYVGISDWFQTTGFCNWLNTWWTALPGSAKMASLGFMIFGCGCEMAGTTVSKAIAKWFKGKEMSLAMGVEMAIARLGVFAVMWISPAIYNKMGTVVAPVAFCTTLILIGLICFIVFTFMDRKLDKELIAAGEMTEEKSPEDEFHLKDLGQIFSSKMFWIVAIMCVLYYSAIFPFQRYAPDMLSRVLGVEADTAAHLVSFFPVLAMILTPVLGGFISFKGKAASMLMVGSLVLVACHLSFAYLLPAFPSKAFALILLLILGVSFSLVPAALWPSVPKIIDNKVLGSAYCLIFWVQNVGLCFVPLLIGALVDKTGGYKVPMLVFSIFGILAFFLTFMLKLEDKKQGYGLELPEVKKEDDVVVEEVVEEVVEVIEESEDK